MELKSVSPAARNGEARQESEKRSANTPTPANAQGTLEIIVMPVDRRGRFTARLGDRVILKSTRQPLLDAARILLAEGVAPNTRIAMRHAGENYDALSSTVGTAASLTVVERDKGNGPVFEPWKPRPFSAPPPPMRYSGRPLLTPAPDASAEKTPDFHERPGVRL